MFEDYECKEEEDAKNEDNDAINYKYNKMDENKLDNILQEPNHFQVPQETEEKQEYFFKEAEENPKQDLFKYLEGNYELEDEEDISLESDDKYGEE